MASIAIPLMWSGNSGSEKGFDEGVGATEDRVILPSLMRR